MSLEKLRVLYPTLSDEELAIACENLDRYLLLAWEIYEDVRIASHAVALTTENPDRTIDVKVDSPTQ